jgi:predicted DNA-binding transcriptional regulator AlpA
MAKNTKPIPTNANALVEEDQAADFLALSHRTLRNWRSRGGGPKYIKVSAGCIRYRVQDLHDWIERKTRRSTSDLGIFR